MECVNTICLVKTFMLFLALGLVTQFLNKKIIIFL